MTRSFFFIVISIILFSTLSGCHAGQEKAWKVTMETIDQKIAEDEFLSKHIHHVELERRQFVRVHINPQTGGRGNFANITVQIAQIAGETLFAQEGNEFTEITIKGNLVDGDEVIVCTYSTETGVLVIKDRTIHTM